MIEWIKKATTGNVSGNHKFYVKTEPPIVDTAATITVTPFTDRTEQAIVPCHYRWFRLRNGLTEEASRFKGNSYVCDSSDIGATIQVQVTSNDPQFSGQARVQFGPVKLSLQIKKHLMDTLVSGSAFIRGMVCFNQYLEKECQFKIFEDLIKICHLQSELNYSFNYSSNEPRIELNSKDPTKVTLLFSQNEPNLLVFIKNLFGHQYQQNGLSNNGPMSSEPRIQLRFAKRQIKDIFLLTLRGFFTKKQLKNSAVIHKIQTASFNEQKDIQLIFEIQTLRSDVARLFAANEQKEREKQRLNQQVYRLQRDMEEIVTTYTRIADDKVKNMKDLNESYVVLVNKKEDVFGRKCQHLEEENNNLNERIKLLTAEIDQIRINTSLAKKNQTMNPNFTHVTTIKMNSQINPKNQVTSFENILEHLSESKVTDFNEDSFKMTKQLERVNDEKNQLQRNLQKSFRVIDDLEKKLKSQPFMNQSAAVNFNKKEFPVQVNSSFYSLSLDLQKIQTENSQLKKMNEVLKKQNTNLHNQVKSAASSRIIIKPMMMGSNENMKVSMSNTNNNSALQVENENLKKEVAGLKQSLTNEEAKVERYLREKIILERKIQQLTNQIVMYRKNQEVLNRSQHLSMEMQSYNEQKLTSLQANNDFLIAENEKLSKALEKYMAEARQNIKLRKQVLELKEKASKDTLNPEKICKSICEPSNCNTSSYSEVLNKL